MGDCLLSSLQQFLQVFPELRQAPLFTVGESYAGKYIPVFGHYIHHYQNDSMPINLKVSDYLLIHENYLYSTVDL